MKKLIVAFASLLTLSFAQAQTADEIIDKHLAAIGGKENLAKLNSVIIDGGMSVQGAEIAVTVTSVQGKGTRQDINAMGMKGFDITTATEGWRFMPFLGQTKFEPKTAEEVKESQEGLDVQSPFLNYKEKGHSVEYLGTEDVEGTECHKLKVTFKWGSETTYFLDPKSFYLVRAVSKIKMMGQETENKVDMSDYRDVNGYKMPFSISQAFGALVVKEIKVNVAVDDKIFKPE